MKLRMLSYICDAPMTIGSYWPGAEQTDNKRGIIRSSEIKSTIPMNLQTCATFALVAGLAIASPGPAVLLTIRNGTSYGAPSVIWSALGNICGVFLLSTASILGLGVVLMSSAWLFTVIKIFGALYLFYIGFKNLFKTTAALPGQPDIDTTDANLSPMPDRLALYSEGLLTAVTNPKALLFFTALFPQFVQTNAPVMSQFIILTGIFMGISLLIHMVYGRAAARAAKILQRPSYSRWVNRLVGATFITFGGLLLAFRQSRV
jgi:threonine/homoserine/homoserine lactone efflux protein